MTLVYCHSGGGFPGDSVVKNPSPNEGDTSSMPGSGISPGEANDNPLQYSCWGHPMDRGAWRATVPGAAKSWTWFGDQMTIAIFRFSYFRHCLDSDFLRQKDAIYLFYETNTFHRLLLVYLLYFNHNFCVNSLLNVYMTIDLLFTAQWCRVLQLHSLSYTAPAVNNCLILYCFLTFPLYLLIYLQIFQ